MMLINSFSLLLHNCNFSRLIMLYPVWQLIFNEKSRLKMWILRWVRHMSNLCQPTYLVPWYGQKKFKSIFLYFDLPNYLPIKKIWKNLEKKVGTFIMPLAFLKIRGGWVQANSISHNKPCTFIWNCRFLESWNTDI